MYHLNLEDVTCGHCAATVEKAVQAADPKAKVTVNLEAKTASIESEIGSDAFIAAIEGSGYRASIKKSCCSHVD
ncbi:heavy-metal-associated domain-containing protein [Ensifer sp. D2-11]